MQPTLCPGQIVIVSNMPYLFTKPKIGDIVAVKIKNTVLIKRIKKIKGEKYFLRGDNQIDSFDSYQFGWVEKKYLLGKVIFF